MSAPSFATASAAPIAARSVPRAGTLALLLLLAIVFYLVGAPLIGTFVGAVTDTPPGVVPHLSLQALGDAYRNARHFQSLLNSLIFAALVSTLVLVLGGGLDWAAARTDSSLSRFVDLFVLVPIFIPAVLFVAGWVLLLGPKNGMINMLFTEYLGFKQGPFNIYSFAGMVWVGTLQELPLAFLWLWPAFRAMNPDLEEAAQVAGAGFLTTLRRITLPILRPTIVGAWIIFFIYSLGALSVPLLIGLPAKIFLYSTEIYLAYRRVPSDLNIASAYSLMFLLVTFVSILAYRRATRDASRFVTVTGKAFRPRIITLGRWQLPATAFAVALLLLVAGLPLFVLVWNAFLPYPQAPSLASIKLLTTKNFAAALDYEPAKRAVVNSLILGVGAGFVATVLGALIAWLHLRWQVGKRWIALLDQLATAPLAIPGMIFGVGLAWLYLVVPLPFYRTRWILLLAYVAIHLPFAVRICLSGL